MKTICKSVPILLLLALFPALGAFKPADKDYKDFYIYLYSHEKGNHDNVYVSDMIHYQMDACGESYNWRPKAEKAFKDYLKAEHDVDYDYVYMIGSTTGNFLDTQQKAKDALNEWQAKHKNDSHTVTKTLFKYSCK